MTILRSAVAATTITGLTLTLVGISPATATTPSETTHVQTAAHSPAAAQTELTEDELKELGLTKDDAQQLESDFSGVIDQAEKDGTLTAAQAKELRTSLLEPEEQDGTDTQVLPVWAATAIVGCAATVATGEAKTQVKNALKNGGVDSATDIAIGIGVDCVFGAIPGGAIGAAVKKALTSPIKTALKPHVKKIVEKIARSGDDG
ncbi:MAG: hypothetical protein ACTH2U_15540 [Brevibacterium sp.]